MNNAVNGAVKAPWLKFFGEVPATLDYPDCTMAEAVFATAKKYPDNMAYEFMGSRTTYQTAA